MTTSHTPPAPLRPSHREEASKRAEAPRATPTLAQQAAAPLLIQVVAEPGAVQPTPRLQQRSAPPPAAKLAAAPQKPLAAIESAPPLPAVLLAAAPGVHHIAPVRTRPADGLAPSAQPHPSAPPLVTPTAMTPPAAPAPPVIRVTIGRIVIKAESGKPSKPARAPSASAQSGLSLDAYLQTRRGGDA